MNPGTDAAISSQPDDFLLVGTASKHDATDVVPTVAPRDFDDSLAVLAAIEAFDLPDIGLDARVLQRRDAVAISAGRSLRS